MTAPHDANAALDKLRAIYRSPMADWYEIVDMVRASTVDAEEFSAQVRAAPRPSLDAEIQRAAEGKRGARKALAQALSDAALTVPGAAYDAADLLIIARCQAKGMSRPKGIEYRPHRVGGER
jgi:hypothetical protein